MKKLALKIIILLVFTLCIVVPASVYATADTWVSKQNMPTGRSNFGATELNGLIYTIGGMNSSNTYQNKVEAYDPITDTWSTKASLPTPRFNLTVASVNNKIYAMGGTVSGGLVTSIVEEYDPTTNTWASKASMPTLRTASSAIVLNGKIYVAGGYTISDYLTTFEMYDPLTDTWTTKANMITPKGFSTLQVANGKIYSIGGVGGTPASSLSVLEEYDPLTNIWSSKKNMPAPRRDHASAALNNKIFVLGGNNSTGGYLNSFLEYEPISDTWTSKANMILGRTNPSSIAINGKIYAIGGRSGGNTYTTSLEEYTVIDNNAPGAPLSLTATGSNSLISLNWSTVISANSYNIKRAITPGGPYTTIATGVTGTTYADNAVSSGITYYYIVSAVNIGGESGNSNEASATTSAQSRYVLNITMTNGLEQEFDLSKAEFDAYVNWYDSRATGTGLAKYTFDSPLQKGSTTLRKVSVAFDKIMKYDFDEYAINGSIVQADSTSAITSGFELTLTLGNGSTEEFILSTAEYNAFSTWYDGQSNGTGLARYTFMNPHANGPFLNRSNVVIFDKISEIDANSFNITE